MSLARQFLREFRPLFRVLEEPLGRPYPALGRTSCGRALRSFRRSHFSARRAPASRTVPAVDVSEEPGAFVVEAEIPGVKKENIDLRIGDDGQSLTIEGRTFIRSGAPAAEGGQTQVPEGQAPQTEASPTNELTQTNNTSTQLSTERTFTGASSFSRTVWLPRRVNGSEVSAKLTDGILTVRIPKAEDQESIKVKID
ncbi:HSP20-like chaperone [Phellopilus nigrolimitatus]|nr:HSP20-like chaperone [Phellopilus nigrolimitatus]